jgi:hypothetical protein
MLSCSRDGGVAIYKAIEGDSVPQSVLQMNTDGLLYAGAVSDFISNGEGTFFSGRNLLTGSFKMGCPDGVCVSVRDGSRYSIETYTEGCLSSTHVVSEVDVATDSLCEDFDLNPIIESAFSAKKRWIDIIPTDLFLHEDPENILPLFGTSARCPSRILGLLRDRRVVLTRLCAVPPDGKYSLAAGVDVNVTDIWIRRIQRLVNSDTLPVSILRPVGIWNHADEYFVVSLLPEGFSPNSVVDLTVDVDVDTGYDMILAGESVLSAVKDLHDEGVYLNGRCDWHIFFFMKDGTALIDTSYLLSDIIDPHDVLGGVRGDGIRFCSGNRIARYSNPIKIGLQRLALSLPPTIPQVRDDGVCVGLFLSTLVSESDIPLYWLSNAQYVLMAVFQTVKSQHLPHMSVICKQPEDIFEAHPLLEDLDGLHPISRISEQMVKGGLSVNDALTAIKDYSAWMNHEGLGSVESEVRAAVSSMSDALKNVFSQRPSMW